MESDDPKHYKKSIQTWDAIISQLSHDEGVGYLKGSICKHLFRFGGKHGSTIRSKLMDVKKADKYLKKLIEILDKKNFDEKKFFKQIDEAEKFIEDNNITKLFEKDKDE